ncbi:MAG: DUF4836 family protein [Bacteroidota bacterium]
MISKHFTGFAVAAIVLLASCGKKAPGYTRYIPKDASNVISIDVKSMLTKLNSDSLTVENMLGVLKDTAHPGHYTMAISKYNELKDAGIDFESKVYISVSSLETMNTGGSPEVQMVAGVKDAAKLEAFLKKQEGISGIVKGDGFSYVNEEDHVIGWNSDALMVLSEGHRRSYEDYMPDDSTGSRPKSESNVTGAVEKLKKYFKLEKKESILSVDGFNDLQGKQGDITIFNQANLDGINAMAFAFVPKLKELIEGTYSSTVINFEDGKAVVENKSFVSKKMGEILKKYAGPEVDLAMIENYPSQNINGVIAFSFNPQLIPAFIRETGLDALLGLGLAQTGMGLDDFAKVFKGDFAVAVSDFAVVTQEVGKDSESYRSERPTAKMIFTAKIGDKAAFDKLVSFAVKEGGVIRNGNMLVMAENGVAVPDMPFAISTANDMLTFASDSATLAAFQSKTQKIGLPDDVKAKLKGNSIAAFFDIEKVLNGISPSLFDSSQTGPANIFSRAKTTFKNGWFTTNNFDGKSVTGKGELVFSDSKKNSLAQLVRFSMYAAQEGKAHKAANMKKWEEESKAEVTVMDSIPLPPPPPTKPKRK